MKNRIRQFLVFYIVLLIGGCVICLASCAIPPSAAVQAHAAGESAFTPVSFDGKRGVLPPVSPESSKAHDFWGAGR